MSRLMSATAAVSALAPKLFDKPRIVIPAINAALLLRADRRGFARRYRAPADPIGEQARHADDHHVDDRERGHRLDITGLVETVARDRERDGARREQQERRRELLDHRHEHQEPAGEQAGPY